MKKILLSLSLTLLAISVSIAQPATDFTATDCNSTAHNLFTELNSGKVIVLNWVMPCTTCIPGSVNATNIVQGYAASNPGQVLQYIIDDDGGQSCTTLTNWVNTNGVMPDAVFRNQGVPIPEAPYGGSGMPHIAVVGPDHNIYFNGLNAAANNPTAITNAINQALLATGIQQTTSSSFHLSVSPESKNVKVNYSLSKSADVTLDMLNETGQLVTKKELGRISAGNNSTVLELAGIASGIYFIRFRTENNSQTVKFSVTE